MVRPKKTSHELTEMIVNRVEGIIARAGIVLREYERDEVWQMVLETLVKER